MISSRILSSLIKIDTLYVHDDRYGPFTRITIAKDNLLIEGCSGTDLEEKWHPSEIIIPTYHKICLPYVDLKKKFQRYHIDLCRKIKGDRNYINIESIEWALYLSTVNEFKQALRTNNKYQSVLSKEEYLFTLQEDFPKYLWVAEGYVQETSTLCVLLVFDATDINIEAFPYLIQRNLLSKPL